MKRENKKYRADKRGRKKKPQRAKTAAEKYIEGELQGSERGYAFLLNEGGDYYIAAGDLNGALHGDKVKAREIRSRGHSRQAAVVKILERGRKTLSGTYVSNRYGGFVTADERRFFADVFIAAGKNGGAETGDKVAVTITKYPSRGNPEGEITEIFGRQFDRNAEVRSIAYACGVAGAFPAEVEKAALSAAAESAAKECARRRDFTGEIVFTVDGEDSRDFDDAVSLKKEGDFYLLGVHIADVSHYVKEGGAVDKEAFERATSVYFPEAVVPMLPESLSNGACSLVEGEIRLTLSCLMKVDGKGNVADCELAESFIKSSARLTYTEVQKIFDGDETLRKKRAPLVGTLEEMRGLYKILAAKRAARGSVDFEIPEAAISVDENGAVSLGRRARDDAHRLIEEFMILANETVAETLFSRKAPCVYRIHEAPEDKKLAAFYDFIAGLGVAAPKKSKVCGKDFSELLDSVKEESYAKVVNTVMLRSMQKAKYAPRDVGHFGLASEHYCHFTSPIRRYPDLAVHRIVKSLLHGGVAAAKKYGEETERVAAHASAKELKAQEAERAADDFYKTLYLSAHIGEAFDAVISGVTNFGIFAELENTAEGLIRIETLKGGWYEFDEKNLLLKNKEKAYRLGQPIRVRVDGVDAISRKAEFSEAET